MAFLRWSAARIESAIHPQWQQVLKIQATRDEVLALREELRAIFPSEPPPNPPSRAGLGPELRHELTSGWNLFWKKREGESRVFLAHPEADQWVATIALVESFGQSLMARLELLEAGQHFDLSSLGPLNKMSNLDISIEVI